jgi:hypothetical protein
MSGHLLSKVDLRRCLEAGRENQRERAVRELTLADDVETALICLEKITHRACSLQLVRRAGSAQLRLYRGEGTADIG